MVAVPDGETRWAVGARVGAPWHGGHDGKKGTFEQPWLEGDHAYHGIVQERARPVNEVYSRCARKNRVRASPIPSPLAVLMYTLPVNGVTRDGGYAEYVTLRTEAVVSGRDKLTN